MLELAMHWNYAVHRYTAADTGQASIEFWACRAGVWECTDYFAGGVRQPVLHYRLDTHLLLRRLQAIHSSHTDWVTAEKYAEMLAEMTTHA